MASCCPGVTECEHVITIGFLNTFIGSDIQDSNGNATSAAGDNTYCPTYSELTGGTLIQNWKKGTTPNGDRDGIVIGGSYAANECVRREDLSMKYTRFKSLDVSASPLKIDACSGCSTLSFTHLYNRYEKKLNGSCEGGASPSVEEASDTVSGHVSYSSSNNVFSVSGNQVCVGKNNPNNNGRSNSRSTVITAKITFRGTDHTDTVTITQAGLTGTYKFWYSTYSTHDEGVSCTGGPNFGCAGGSYGATAYYYRDDWDVYRYQDKCGTNYNSDTEQRNRVNDQYRVYDTYSGSFSDKTGLCGTWPDSVSWPGYGSCSWTQTCNECGCEPPCDDCDSIAWGNGTYTGTIGCSGGRVRMNNITIPGTSYTWSYDDETSGCTASTAETSTTRSTSVDIGCNTTTRQRTFSGTKNNISYSITQSAGPCCTPSVTYQYETVSLTCEAHENESVRAKYTAVTVDECCSTTYPTAYTEYYTVNVGCNSGNTRYLTASEKSNAPFPVQQAGDSACCITCQCSDLTLGKTSESWAYNVTTSKDITITSASCVTGIAISSPTHFNATLGTNKVTVSPKGNNTSLSDYVDTLTVTYNGSCSSAITLTQYYQPPVPCTCNDLTVSPTSLEFDWDGASMPQRVDITSAACVTNIQASCQGGTFFSMMGQDCVYVDVDDNTTTGTLTGTLTITYNDNCSSAVTLTQTPRPTCNDFTYSDMQIHDGDRIPTSVGMSFDLVKVTGPSYNDVASIGVTTTGNVTLVDREHSGTGQIFVVRFPTVSSPEVATITLYYGGNVCREYEIFRVCPCGTDDCESNLGGGYIINNEINADSWVLGNDGSTSFTYNGVSYPYRYMNGDSLCCDPSKVQVVSDSGDKYLAASTYISDGDGNTYHLGGWSAITNGGNVMVGYRPGTGTDTDYGMITYTLLTNNYTTSRKDYSVTFKVDAGTPLGKNSPIYNQLWPNATVCTQFTVNIRQAPSGGKYDRHGGCQPNQYGVARRKLEAKTGPCWPGQENNRQIIIDNNHSCMLPPFSPDSYH